MKAATRSTAGAAATLSTMSPNDMRSPRYCAGTVGSDPAANTRSHPRMWFDQPVDGVLQAGRGLVLLVVAHALITEAVPSGPPLQLDLVDQRGPR